MRVAIVGGKLQGIEAVYLAQQAGWQVVLIDRNPKVPARGLAHDFIQADVTTDTESLVNVFRDSDLILPALENDRALESLEDLAKKERLPFAYDKAAYAITSSKQKSDSLFKELDLPAPRSWPECGFPAILKPSTLSGSQGVQMILTKGEFTAVRKGKNFENGNWIIQEYLEGPSYSLEVVGRDGVIQPLQSTILEVDSSFDCRRVIGPSDLSPTLQNRFGEISTAIAEAIHLTGIMDVEVILHEDELKILEIDARLPSQTPTAVLKSTGINMLELLYQIFNKEKIPDIPVIADEKPVIYEHIQVCPGSLEILGEHIMARAGMLRYQTDFFGADEALTDYSPDQQSWAATLILTGETQDKVVKKHHRVLETIRETLGLRECSDLLPE